MTQQRRRRLERLEARQPTAKPWVDPAPLIERLWPELMAVVAGRACWRKLPDRELSEEAVAALELAMRDADRMHERLTAERR
jgi:hypothetical protein